MTSSDNEGDNNASIGGFEKCTDTREKIVLSLLSISYSKVNKILVGTSKHSTRPT